MSLSSSSASSPFQWHQPLILQTPIDDIPPLLPSQRGISQIQENVLSQYFAFLNNTPTGGGKTYITLNWIRRVGNLPVIIIGPTNVRSMWLKKCQEFGVGVVGYYTHFHLAGKAIYPKSGSGTGRLIQPVCPFLRRIQNMSIRSKPTFCVTPSF